MTETEEDSGGLIGALIDGVIRFCLENKLIISLLLVAIVGWGLMVLPFDYELEWFPRNPVPVDAIPDTGENQQIVFTNWPGRSPQDIEDQVTYPLTVSLLGVPGVRTIRSYSYLGFSSIYVVFKEDVDFYWSRSRILERLSVAKKDLPEGVSPALGPDATALGQIFWYTLEGRDVETGLPTGGWDLDELRSVQDWDVRYKLASAEGVSEVASVGGFVREYQIDVDPDKMRSYNVTLAEVYNAVRKSNIDVGARTIEINSVEYVIRGLGFIRSVDDLEKTVIKTNDNVPVYIRHVAHVSQGPAVRRGALDKGGAEAVGGVVVVRYGENPLKTIKNVKDKIDNIAPGMPKKTLADGSVSQVTIVPFYDRTKLIHEVLGTLETALTEEILVTIIVIIVMVMHLRSSLLISALLPLAVMIAFIAMWQFRVDSNLMSLAGIAIAIGTMVDMGIILCENMLKHLDEAAEDESRLEVIYRAACEVGRPVLTAILTTIISFLPVFFLVGAEGKMFRPLAFTKSFALLASVIVALTLLPVIAHVLFTFRLGTRQWRMAAGVGLIAAGAIGWGVKFLIGGPLFWASLALVAWGVYQCVKDYLPEKIVTRIPYVVNALAVVSVLVILTGHWMPLGIERGYIRNLLFITICIFSILGIFLLFMRFYAPMLRFFLAYKPLFYLMPISSVVLGLAIWLGFAKVFFFVPPAMSLVGVSEKQLNTNFIWSAAAHALPGLGNEFMPPFDEGSYLFMPSTMPHASIGEAFDALQKQDLAIGSIPEVESVVGKIGRVESPLDPAPIAMVETVVSYYSEYKTDINGRIKRFRFDREQGKFIRDDDGELIEDPKGRPFRQWRPHIRTPDDIWDEIVEAGDIPGSTRASKLQPIETRRIMLQSGIRARMAVQVLGDSLEDVESVVLQIEKLMKEDFLEAAGVNPATVSGDRIIGKPYLEIEIDREAIARYGISIRDVQDVIETAIGGRNITTTIEGRERYGVRVRYQRELRDSIESIERILVAASDGSQIPLGQVSSINYVRGPQAIKTLDTRFVGYVTFDMKKDFSEVEVVKACQQFLKEKRLANILKLPKGTDEPSFIGSYENQVRSAKTMSVVLPLALFLIFIILYLHFRSVSTTLLVLMGVVIASSGGMILIWFYSFDNFADFAVFGINLRDVFQVRPFNMSIAVGVGFIALFGIATDDGVVIASYLDQSFQKQRPQSIADIREATVQAGLRRIRPCLMTTATTILALMPVLTSTGRGSDVMIPMAIPSYGGMLLELMTLFFVPVSYCWVQELRFRWQPKVEPPPQPPTPVEVPLQGDVIS